MIKKQTGVSRVHHFSRGYSTLLGLIVVIFVMLVGALGYTYITNHNAQVATTNPPTVAVNASSQVAPEINQAPDLDKALTALETVDADTQQLDSTLMSLDASSAEF